jgi:hypothetical protein
MNKAMLLGSIMLALIACSRTDKSIQSPTRDAVFDRSPASSPRSFEEHLLFYPDRERVLTSGDNSNDDMSWQSLGITLSTHLADVLYGLTLVDTPLMDRDGNSKGTLIPEASRFTLLEAGQWQQWGTDFRRLYRVRTHGGQNSAQGWIDSSAAALILTEANGLAVGIVPRKIVIGGGESEYSLLALADGQHVTLVDTSIFQFPDSFHPSGVLQVSLEDVNADSQPEVLLEAETIVSLRFLGETPLRWKAWLRRREGTLVPIFRYNVSFGSDAGYSYSATERAFDSNGSGMRDLVRVDTSYTFVSGQEEFRATTVSFYPWNGNEFRRATLQDLPKMGIVSTDHAPLFAQSDARSQVLASLSKGEQLFIFDRSDTYQSRDDPSSWWYKAVTKLGTEGWVSGTVIKLSWIDPLKFNRAVFLGTTQPP